MDEPGPGRDLPDVTGAQDLGLRGAELTGMQIGRDLVAAVVVVDDLETPALGDGECTAEAVVVDRDGLVEPQQQVDAERLVPVHGHGRLPEPRPSLMLPRE